MTTTTITLGQADIQRLYAGHPFVWNLPNGDQVELVLTEGALSARRQLKANIERAAALGDLLSAISSFL